jgi:antitoxin component YwqK of YwqJK toxin-antitoxin module
MVLKEKLSYALGFLLVLSGTFLNAQEIINENGWNRMLHPNGKLASEGLMRDGKPNGFWKSYYPNGIIKSEGNRKNHLLDSIWIFFNENGDTLQKVNYIMGKKNGYTLTYNTDYNFPLHRGVIIQEELYVNDSKEGISRYFYSNGKLKESVHFVNGLRDGLSKEFDDKGNIVSISTYRRGSLINRERINRYDTHGLKQGVWKEFDSNGMLLREFNYDKGVLNGFYKEYNLLGELTLLLRYDKGVISPQKDTSELDIELITKYNDLGKRVYSGSYKKGIPIGIHREFSIDGKVTKGWIYNADGMVTAEGIILEDGRKEGFWKYYNSHGEVRSIGSFVNDKEQGTWKFFNATGRLVQEGTFKDGRLDGTWKWYFDNGDLKREEEFYNGKEEGIYMEYDSLGSIIAQGTYFDGQREGEWYCRVGDFSERGKYIGDLKDGKWQAFYANGTLKYEGFYIQGNPDGEHKFYYPNGMIKELNYYSMGIKENIWKKYSEDGVVIIAITYRNNREFRINGEKVNFSESDVMLIE